MSDFAVILRKLRNEYGYTQDELAKKLNVSKSRINMYERGEREPNFEMLEKIADFFNVDMNYLLGKKEKAASKLPNNLIPLAKIKTRKVPLIGSIACGVPITAVENIEEYIDMDTDIHADFALRCKGDSMINARIFNGDIVYIREQPMVENGEIAAVIIDDMESEATLKRVYMDNEHIILHAENPVYNDMAFYHEDMNQVRIIGKAVAFLSTVK